MTILTNSPIPCTVFKEDDHTVTVGNNTMSVSEFTARMSDLGFNKASIPATLRQLKIGGRWVLSLPPQQAQFLATSGDFIKFARSTSKGFGN